MSVESDYEETKKKLLAMLPEGETETDIIVSEEESLQKLEDHIIETDAKELSDEELREQIKERMKDERLTDEQIIELKLNTLKRIEEWPRNRGRKEYIIYLNGGSLSARQAIIGKCFDCCGGYPDGTMDCYVEDCVLHDFMPYREGGRIIRRGKNKTEENEDETESTDDKTE
jgi:hypothetical protein